MMKVRIARTITLGLLLCCGASALTFTINETKAYQRIQGFGGMDYYTSDVNDMVNDLGVNTIRFELSGLNPAETGGKQADMATLKAFKDGGVRYFIGSNWNAPAQFKDATSHIIPAQYGALADWVVTRVKNFKDNVGVDPYAVSLQNEADLGPSQFYDACYYTSADFQAIIKLLGPKLKMAGYTTKIFWSEGMITNSGYNRVCMDAVMKDTAAKKHVAAYAVHGYGSDGITPAAPQVLQWKSIGDQAFRYNLPLWMTETSSYGDPDQWVEAMKFAKWLYVVLKYGKLSLHTYHYMSLNQVPGGAIASYFVEAGVKIPMYYAYKQFVRYIREGAVQLDCVASDTSVPPPAVFADTTAKTLTMVFVNDGAAKTYGLSGAGLPLSFTQYLTTATEKCVNKGTVQSNASMTIPANSIMTLVGTYTKSIVSVRNGLAVRMNVKPAAAAGRLFDITGRRIQGGSAVAGLSIQSGVKRLSFGPR